MDDGNGDPISNLNESKHQFLTTRAGVDWQIKRYHTLTISDFYGSEKII